MKAKVVGGIALAVIVVVVIGVVFVLSNLNSIVAKAIEVEGGKVTGTDVGVDGVNIKLADGSGAIDNLTIANPDGFAAGNAFSLGNITIDLDVNSLQGDPLVIEEIRISAPVASAVLNEKGLTNIDALRQHVIAYTAGLPGAGDGGDSEPAGSAKKIRIKKFIFEKGRIEIDATAVNVEKQTLDLPEVILEDMGGADGAPADQIVKDALLVYTKQATTTFVRSELRKLVEKQMGGSIEDKAKEALNKLIK
jgi:hypothetical protein